MPDNSWDLWRKHPSFKGCFRHKSLYQYYIDNNGCYGMFVEDTPDVLWPPKMPEIQVFLLPRINKSHLYTSTNMTFRI
jgi:hypothetical protein